jgi:hypothetical protein
MLTYSQLTRIQKIDLINGLRAARLKLLDESKKKRLSRGSKAKRKLNIPKLAFASPELEKIFNSMSDEEKRKLIS